MNLVSVLRTSLAQIKGVPVGKFMDTKVHGDKQGRDFIVI